jgi:hypothetical protein
MSVNKKSSLLKCVAEGCIYQDTEANRNCTNWRPQVACGFIDDTSQITSQISKGDWFVSVYAVPDTNLPSLYPEVDTEIEPPWLFATKDDFEDWVDDVDMVDAPPHYMFIPPEDCQHSGWEVKDIIKIAVLKNFKNFAVGASLYWQVLKYLLRCGCKDNMLEDLKKSEHYLKDLIKEVEERDGNI